MIKLKNKYNSLAIGLKASIWYTLCNLVVKGISFITVPIFSRVLPMEEYGVLSLYNSWLQIVTIIVTLNLFMGVFPKGIIKFAEKENEFVSSMQILVTLLSFVSIVSILILKIFIGEFKSLSNFMIVFMIIQIHFNSAINFWTTRMRFKFKYIGFILVTLLIGIITPAINLGVALFVSSDAEWVIFISGSFQILIGLILYKKNLEGNNFFDFASTKMFWKYALIFNIPLVPYYLSQIILDQIDRVMIGNYFTSIEVAIYNIPYQLSMALTIFSSSISNSFIPTLYSNIKQGTENSLKNLQNQIIYILSTIVVLLILFAPELMIVLAPKEYYKGLWIIAPVVISMYFKYLIGIFNNIEFYYEKPRVSMLVAIISAVFNVISNLILLPIFGFVIAGYTTLFSFYISFLLHLMYLKKQNYDQSYDTKKVLVFSHILMITALFEQLSYKYTLLRILIIFIIILILLKNKHILFNILKNRGNI